MKLTTGLAVSLAVLVTGLYTWGISTDPEGFGGLVRDRARPVEGAVPLSGVDTPRPEAGTVSQGMPGAVPVDGAEASGWQTIAENASQAIVFKLRPPDASDLDESFRMYLDGLTRAVEARNIDAVLSRSAENIVVSQRHLERVVDLKELLSSSGGQNVWQQLHDVLSLPMAKGPDGAYCAPWFNCQAMPEEAGIVEPFETVFVTGENVPVYAAPSAHSRRLVELSFDAVRLSGTGGNPDWFKVQLPANRTGYIARDQVRMMFDTRVDFELLESGLWAMTSLVIVD